LPSPAAGVELARADATRAPADPALAADAAAAIDALGLDLYRLAGPGNLMLSPASSAIALSMARAGARGQTAEEMDTVLRGLGSDALADAGNALDAALAARTGTFPDASGKDHDVTLRIANALFAQRDMPLEPTKIEVWLPRFDIESSVELADALAALGMPTAFSESADFSGITTAADLHIDKVVHEANMTVDEKGTEAAAATVVIMRLSGVGAEVRVDRPFLVVLRDVPTGAIVFLGRVADPSESRS